MSMGGGMAERPKAAVLKTADPKGSGGSNPSPSARPTERGDGLPRKGGRLECSPRENAGAERWPSGRRRQIANLLRGYPAPPRVRIPASPPFSFLPFPGLRAVPAFLGLLLFLFPSCKGPTWTIESTPPKAEVFLDGRRIGATPAVVEGVYPGTRELLLTAPGREARTFLLDLRPGPPGWIFPLDFPLDLGLALFTSRDRVLYLTLPSARKKEIPEPGREEIKAMTDRALELSRKRVD